jgi:Tfp pilus assembly protein PilF
LQAAPALAFLYHLKEMRLSFSISMRGLVVLALAVLLLLAWPAEAQQAPPVRQITGQIKLAGRPAPAGVPVVLQLVLTGDPKTSGTVVARTATDSQGRFTFDHLENAGKDQGKNFFEVSALQPGFEGGVRVVDLTEATREEVVLDLRPDFNAPSPARPPAPTAPARASSNAASREAMEKGQELLFRGHDPEASLVYFKKAVQQDPWYGPGYMLLGLANMQLQRWSDAQWAFEEAGKVEPGNAQAFVGVGSALNQQRQFAEAQKALEHSLELRHDSAEAHYELARSLAATGKWQAAAPHAKQAIELNTEYAGPHVLMGNIYLQQGDAAAALIEFKEYLRLDPEGSLAPQVKETIAQLEQALAPASKKKP